MTVASMLRVKHAGFFFKKINFYSQFLETGLWKKLGGELFETQFIRN
jgi:hypothetical protein